MLYCGDFEINIGYPLWFLTTFGLLCIGEAIVIYVKVLQNFEALHGVSRAAPLTVHVD